MILLNTTFSVDDAIADDFFDFLRRRYVPAARRCGLGSPLLGKVRVDAERNFVTAGASHSYALQLLAPDSAAADAFVSGHQLPLLAEMSAKWGPSVTYFCTALDIVDSYK